VPSDDSDPLGLIALWNNEKLVPRYDYDTASTTMDEGNIFKECHSSHDVVAIIDTVLSAETSEYAEELFDILTSLSWSKRSVLDQMSASEEIAIRRRIRQLLVLLKGNDVWVYETKFFRRLPERHTVAPKDEPHRLQSRTTVALGPPGEYGETTMRVPIDHGQPFILPAWTLDQTKTG
jgi:hypothetical protein